MNLTGQDIRHVSTITHDSKVLVMGTAADGVIYYAIKRSGFEDAALKDGADAFGFEDWKKLPVGESVHDESVVAYEQSALVDTSGKPLLRSVYGNSDEATKSAVAPVQLVSAFNYLYVFRQSPSGKILVSRFVLDGITNELLPKLEVRFRRSEQRLRPQQSRADAAAGTFDNLDYRDMDGNNFFEPSIELSFTGTAQNGWFSVIVVPTSERDRSRWHLFVYDATTAKLTIWTVGAGENGLFDVKDYLYGEHDPADPDNIVYRSIPGIICRTIDMQTTTVAGCPSATTYDIQREQMTDAGPQLMRDVMRAMLAVPVKVGGADPVKTAVLDFALAADGSLSQIDLSPDTSALLRNTAREVVTPLSLFDDIKEIATDDPPPAGTIAATERGEDDQLQVRSKEALPADMKPGARVKVRGTQSYDGPYTVSSVDGNTFKVAATFQNVEAGYWEVVPENQTGLVFDNMVVGTEKTTDGKLMIRCPAHDLKVGDEVQISGTREYDGIFPITAVDTATSAFVLDAPFFTGEAANLSKVVRRGLRMNGDDWVETPDLELVPPSPERGMGRTLSAWVRVDAEGNLAQTLIQDSGGLMSFELSAANKVRVTVQMSDGTPRTVIDPNTIPIGKWTHYAASVDYNTARAGDTRIALCKDGVEVAQLSVTHGMPCHLGDQVLDLDGTDDYVEVPAFSSPTTGVTVSAWARSETANFSNHGCIVSKRNAFILCPVAGTQKMLFSVFINNVERQTAHFTVPDIQSWHLYTGTYDGQKVRLYVDGEEAPVAASFTGTITTDNGIMLIGRDDGLNRYFKGKIAGVELWSRARTKAEIVEGMGTRWTGRETDLVGYWPLDNGTTRDLTPGKRHGSIKGNAAWKKPLYFHPQIVPPAAAGAERNQVMSFDGYDDHIEVPPFASPTSAITVSAWARSATPSWNAAGCLVSKRNSFMLHPCFNQKRIELTVWIGGTARTVGYAPVDIQKWHLYTGTYDGTTLRLFVDGQQVDSATISGAVAADEEGRMCIGHDESYGPLERIFNGQIAEVQLWSVARAAADIQADMYRRLHGKESGLVGYWPLHTGPEDRSQSKRNGSLRGNPSLVNVGSVFSIGRSFSGELSEAQIWGIARPAASVKATMHLQLTGKEQGLAANYRMGAIVYDETPNVVPDFSHNGKNGVVYGDPYAGARRLNRATGSGKKVVQYGSDELVAVSQRGVYEETFEFRVTSPDPVFNPSNVDGATPPQKLFVFSYWGKSSRGSEAIVKFPSGGVKQSDFEAVVGSPGWYKATCRVVVPDGVSLMRAFDISQVRGKWASEATPPATEWTAIDIRKHHIRLLSDTVTKDSYTDAAALSSLPAQSQAVLDALRDTRRAEDTVAQLEIKVANLQARLDVALNNDRYVRERDALIITIDDLDAKLNTATNEREALVNDISTHYYMLRAKHSGIVADFDVAGNRLIQYNENRQNNQLFRFAPLGNGRFKIYSKPKDTEPLMGFTDGIIQPSIDSEKYPDPTTRANMATLQTWWLADAGEGYYYICNGDNRVFDVQGAWIKPNAKILAWVFSGADNQRWAKERTNERTAWGQAQYDDKDATIKSYDDQLRKARSRLEFLNDALSSNESVSSLQAQLSAAQDSLPPARQALGQKNTDLMKMLGQAAPATMPAVATDDRDLVTAGAVLDFAQPVGGARLMESCEGNVLLTYFDTQGRLRSTVYDAAADSRNAAFEQWVPDAVRACADVRQSGDKITLAEAVSLPTNGWTCEAWVQVPLATKTDGSAYDMNLVAAVDGKAAAPIAVRGGRRLGLLVDGWFFDSGADLELTLAAGWHHLAVSSSRGESSFYADGIKLGSRDTAQPVLRFNGTSDYIEVAGHASPTPNITVSIWARSASATWNESGNLVSKRNAFILWGNKGTREVHFWVYLSETSTWAKVFYTPADIEGWHLYTGTYDGHYLRLYIDGEFAEETAVTGTIAPDAGGVMHIGHDDTFAATARCFYGDIAEVAVWKTARGPSEVREDMSRSLTGEEADLFGYWRMERVDEIGGAKVKDLTSGAHHGSVKGAPVDATITTMADMPIKVLGNASGGGSPIGRIAEVRLWNLGLTEPEVAVQARTSVTGNEPGLIAYWPLDESATGTARDRSAGGAALGTHVGVDPVGCTANIGNPGSKVLNLPDRGAPRLQCPDVALASKSFTIECWARRSGADIGINQTIAYMGIAMVNEGLRFGFLSTNQLSFAFSPNDLVTPSSYTDTDWHHLCATYDQPTKKQRIYCDGTMVCERTATVDFTDSGPLSIGGEVFRTSFRGDIAEVRVWDKARTESEIRSTMRRRLSGTEANLLAYYPLDEASSDGKVTDKKSGGMQGQLAGGARLLLSTSLPMAGADRLIASEYSTVEMSGEGATQALMRRFYGYAAGGKVELLPEQRVEELTLQWVGNTQINPTLLGYIEGAPPVPSENFTVADDYDGASTVSLLQTDETGYTFTRSKTYSATFDLEVFLGLGWGVAAGFLAESKLTEGEAGIAFNYGMESSDSKESSISAVSTAMGSDNLTLMGRLEEKESCPAVGRRWIPKNVGYALVLSGMADVFVTKLKRSGRMVSYDIRPVQGVPLDVNTITFMINPAYVLNGSLDGMVGSMPADPTFYAHVPEMRAQYGSLYPASYFRLKDAYERKAKIEEMDKARETYFYNFDSATVNNLAVPQTIDSTPGVSEDTPQASSTAPTQADMDAMNQQNEQKKKDMKTEAQKRKEEIAKRQSSAEQRVRSTSAFHAWQYKMGTILTGAGKRNIVNTYVWDADGGLRVEEQSFASTVEHSMSSEMTHKGNAGVDSDVLIAGFKFKIKALGGGAQVDADGKGLSQSRSLELTVDLSGVEKKGVTDPNDNPIKPGEKVDRYRFMTFYLEGSTDHFNDFFSEVVDPEWLRSNDEEARALRQARTTPEKCWRVMHRVTYVERPALKTIGTDVRAYASEEEDETARGFKAINDRMDALRGQLDQIMDKLNTLANTTTSS